MALVLSQARRAATDSSPPTSSAWPISQPASQPIADGRRNAQLLQRRLAEIPRQSAEQALREQFSATDPTRSWLDRLQHPDRGTNPAALVRQFMHELEESVHHSTMLTAFLWRYVELERLWCTHPDPALRAERPFLDSMGYSGVNYVELMLHFGVSTNAARSAALRPIHRAWGSDFFQRIPSDIRPTQKETSQVPKRMLDAMRSACDSGWTLAAAVDRWRAAIRQRLDPIERVRVGSRSSLSPLLQTCDIETANKTANVPATRSPSAAPADRLELRDIEGTQPSVPARKRSRPSQDQPRKRQKGEERARGPKVRVLDHPPATAGDLGGNLGIRFGHQVGGFRCAAPEYIRELAALNAKYLSDPSLICVECQSPIEQYKHHVQQCSPFSDAIRQVSRHCSAFEMTMAPTASSPARSVDDTGRSQPEHRSGRRSRRSHHRRRVPSYAPFDPDAGDLPGDRPSDPPSHSGRGRACYRVSDSSDDDSGEELLPWSPTSPSVCKIRTPGKRG